MKYIIKNFLVFASIFMTILCSCEDEGLIGVKFDDGAAPGALSNIEIVPTMGGAIINYKLPDDEDILAAEVKINQDGIQKTFSSALYKSSVEIKGLLLLESVEVEIYALDKGGLKGPSSILSFVPLVAPVVEAANTVEIAPDFGGCKVSVQNPTESALNMFLFVRQWDDETGRDSTTLLSTHTFLNDEIEPISERGFDSKEVEFFVLFKDRFGNYSDTVKQILTPIYEIMIPKENHSHYRLPHDVPVHGGGDVNDPPSYGVWSPEAFWDGNILGYGGGFYTLDSPQVPFYDENPLPEFTDEFDPTRAIGFPFTMDLGAVANLSRFTYHPNPGGFFEYGGWKTFAMYGSKETPNEEGTMDGWFELLPKTTVETPENHLALKDEIIANGVNFNVETSQEVRYIRIVFYENYTPIPVFNASEISFFGQVVDEVNNEN